MLLRPPDPPDRFVRTFVCRYEDLTGVVIAPDGSWLATAIDESVRIWGVDGKLRALGLPRFDGQG